MIRFAACVLALMAGDLCGTAVLDSRSAVGSEGILARESSSPRWLPTYPAPFAAGCTPILQLWAGGDITLVGCPTNACGANDQCQGSSGAGGSVKCGCINEVQGAVLCEGIVVFDAFGLVDNWDCFKEDCAHACTKNQQPPAPGQFYACDC
jgi:hypothetical protein